MINPFFNANLYLAKNPDLVAAGLTTPDQLWAHYSTYGAQESLTNANRAPNSWFDVSFYLTSNPDLGAAGVTAGMALDHYHTYGVHEGRVFSPNGNLAPSNFSATTYAQQNADLVTAFGIINPNNPSAAESRDLQAHFLAYGYQENRPGVTPSFADAVVAVNTINVDPILATNSAAYGTAADDAFFTDNGSTSGKIVNGLGGNDSITFKAGASTSSPAVLQNIEKVIVDATAGVSFQSNQLVDLQMNTGAGAVIAAFGAPAVLGQTDVLNVSSSAVNTNVITNGIEQLNFNLANNVTAVTANASQVNGSTLVVDFENGSAASGVTATVASTGSAGLANLTIDGSGLTGALKLNALDSSVANIQNITVYGSTANVAQNFTAVAGSVNGTSFTVEGGAGNDTFAASKAIDLFKGGAGNDTFAMGTNANTLLKTAGGVITGADTILGFSNGDKVTGITGANLYTGSGNDSYTLEQLVTGTLSSIKDGTVFAHSGDTYILVNQDANLADVSLVKLVGVNINELAVTGTTVEFI